MVMTATPTPKKSKLATEISQEYARYFRHLASRVEKAVRSVPREKLWVKPYSYGNSVGHLVLHLTGNLNHYVGAGMAGTGYVRNRAHEFTDPTHYPPEEVLAKFREAVAMVVHTVEALDDDGFLKPAPHET